MLLGSRPWPGPNGSKARSDLKDREDDEDDPDGVNDCDEPGDDMKDGVPNDNEDLEAEGMRVGVCPMDAIVC